MDIEVLLFDIGGTVFDWRTAIIDGLDSIESDAFRSLDRQAFSAAWRKQSLIEVEDVACGRQHWRPFDHILESSLRQALCDFDLPDTPAGTRETLLTCWEHMPAWPGAREALARLQQKYFIAPHTILSMRVAAFSSRHAGIGWDAILSCDGLQAMKPDQASYRRALDILRRPPGSVCFVASHPGDLRAASRHGMRTAYLVARLEDYGDDYRDTGFAEEFDLVVEDFDALADRLGC